MGAAPGPRSVERTIARGCHRSTRTRLMRPPRRLEAPACRTGSPPHNNTIQGPDRRGRRGAWRRRRAEPGPHLTTTPSKVQIDAAAEAPGGAGVPNRVPTSEQHHPRSRSTRPPRRLEAPACRTGSAPQNNTIQGPDRRGRRGAWRRRRAEPGPHPRTTPSKVQIDAAAEAPGGAGVPNRVPPQNNTSKIRSTPKALACRIRSAPQNDTVPGWDSAQIVWLRVDRRVGTA